MYYYKHKFNFSTHAINRIKQRIPLKNKEEFALKEEVLAFINESTYSFDTKSTIYIRYKTSNIYFIITKADNTIITASPISYGKMLALIEEDR